MGARRWLGVVLLLAAGPVSGQAPTKAQVNLSPATPEMVRQLVAASGMTPEQIRRRLQAAGLSVSLFDSLMEPSAVAAPLGLTEDQMRGLRALGLSSAPDGVEDIAPNAAPGSPMPAAPAQSGGLEVFGLSLFRGRNTAFQPMLSGPVPPGYRLGPGDVLVLIITGDVELVHELQVTREGFVLIPQVGQLFVANLTMEQFQELLRRRLGRSYSGIRSGSARFDVTITRLRTNQVFVIGEVVRPGAYQLASVATAMNALYAAGGPTQEGSLRQVMVRRGGRVIETLDLYCYLLAGDNTTDIVLEQGDVVFVPLRGVQASVSGAVIRPAIYELKPQETLADALKVAGGLRPQADLKRIAVHRVLPPLERAPAPAPRVVLDVALGEPRGGQDWAVAGSSLQGAPDGHDGDGDGNGARDPLRGVGVPPVSLMDGDSVVVDWVTAPSRSLTVSVVGMVQKPGEYPWHEGMTLKDLVTLARGPLVGADLREAEVARLPADREGGQLAQALRVPLDSSYLFERDAVGGYQGAAGVDFPPAGSAPDVPLKPYDQVTLFRQPGFERQRAVQVTGELAYPGVYALTRKDERLSDLVRRAGGLLPTAYVRGAAFYRAQGNRGRLNLRLERALQGGEDADVILQPGDSLHVPEYDPTVRVEGAVLTPVSVLYREGAGLDYYIKNAGGYGPNAARARVSVRYANGSGATVSRFLMFRSAPSPGPGSVVTVPPRREREPLNVTALLGNLAQIVAGTVAIVVIATR